MEELIAKRYVKAMKNSSTKTSISDIATVFAGLSASFKDEAFLNIVNNPNIAKSVKSEILLDAVKSVDSSEVNNLIKLLVENNRISIIPALASELRKDVAKSDKKFNGFIYSNSAMTKNVIKDLSDGLGKKFDSDITLEFIKDDFNGIKVEVEDLGIEINFSKTRINNQMIEHIIKAI